MAILGRGLAALIPQSSNDDEEEVAVEEEAVEAPEVEETPAEAPAVKPLEIEIEEDNNEAIAEDIAEAETVAEEAPDMLDQIEELEDEPLEKKTVNVIEEFEDIDEQEGLEPPTAPNITPLTIDPETGAVKEKAVVAEAASEREVVEAVLSGKENEVINDQKVLENEVVRIPVGDIEVNPLQPRRKFKQEELQELTDSLRQHGMLQPMVVIRKEDGRGFQILAGERRWRAAKKLNWETVPVVVREKVWGDRNRLELALTENVQRENLSPIEEALGYKILSDEYGMTHEEIAERVGKSRVSVSNFMRLLHLPAEIQRGLADEKITVGHAKAILMIPDKEKQLKFYQHVVDEGLTVRKAENRARNVQSHMNIDDPLRQKTRGRHALALKYDSKLQEHYDNNVRVKFNSTKNRFEVAFYAHSSAEAEDLIGKLLAAEIPEEVSLPEDE